MSALADAAADYLALRRAVGFKLEQAGRWLGDFVGYVESHGVDTVTVALALAWAGQTSSASQPARRLEAVRGFAKYLQALAPDTEVPPAGLLPSRKHRPVPHLYSQADIGAIMTAARALDPPLRAATTETVIGLLAATGMRVGEVLRLNRTDIAWDDAVVTVWFTKFNKSRHVPVTPSTLAALGDYDRLRRELWPHPPTPGFFVANNGTRLDYTTFRTNFVELVAATGITSSTRRPRIHDLRHSFAVRTLLDWYRDGHDVQARLPRLSTYLGHVDPASTYWYLTAAPELLALAADRLELASGQRP